MRIRAKLSRIVGPVLNVHPALRALAKPALVYTDLVRHTVAPLLPQVIQPDPTEIYVTLTANCNLRCVGCRYGRDFMPGAQLSWPVVRELLRDCQKLRINNIRLYGGEPLLHRELLKIVEYCSHLDLHCWLSTNGILLKDKIDDLYQAGLRRISIGYYGTGDAYNAYVQRTDRYRHLEAGVAYTRERFGMDVGMTLGWVLMRPTCSIEEVWRTWRFAEKYRTPIGVSLIHYSLPYFTEGPDRELQFKPEDRPVIENVVAELIRLKRIRPELVQQSVLALRSIPDWLIKGPDMRVPCDRYRLIWIGADGTVQLCYVTFKLGNLNESRLADLAFTAEHRKASQDAFALRCPNCHCSYHHRIESHLPSRIRYFTGIEDADQREASAPTRTYASTTEEPLGPVFPKSGGGSLGEGQDF